MEHIQKFLFVFVLSCSWYNIKYFIFYINSLFYKINTFIESQYLHRKTKPSRQYKTPAMGNRSASSYAFTLLKICGKFFKFFHSGGEWNEPPHPQLIYNPYREYLAHCEQHFNQILLYRNKKRRKLDLNQHKQFWRLLCYHYIISVRKDSSGSCLQSLIFSIYIFEK